MDLKDTVDLMLSGNYKDRFVAEYHQLRERYLRLKHFNNKIKANREVPWNPPCPDLEFDCSVEMLLEQQRIMGEYLNILEVRAIIEKIDLENYNISKDGEKYVFKGK